MLHVYHILQLNATLIPTWSQGMPAFQLWVLCTSLAASFWACHQYLVWQAMTWCPQHCLPPANINLCCQAKLHKAQQESHRQINKLGNVHSVNILMHLAEYDLWHLWIAREFQLWVYHGGIPHSVTSKCRNTSSSSHKTPTTVVRFWPQLECVANFSKTQYNISYKSFQLFSTCFKCKDGRTELL